MDLVHNDIAHGLQHLPPGTAGQQDIERFGGGHQDMGRHPPHALALRLRGVAGAHQGADIHLRQSLRLHHVPDALQRSLQVLLYIVGQGFQGGDIQDIRLVGQPPGQRFAHQVVNRRQERSQGLAAAGRRRDQGMTALFYRRPGIFLHRCRSGEFTVKPGRGNRVENIG